MSRMKSIFAALLLAAIAGILPQAQAQTLKVLLSGSSAMFNTLALGAYNDGTSIAGGGSTFHWTSASNAVSLHDSRPTSGSMTPARCGLFRTEAQPSLPTYGPTSKLIRWLACVATLQVQNAT